MNPHEKQGAPSAPEDDGWPALPSTDGSVAGDDWPATEEERE